MNKNRTLGIGILVLALVVVALVSLYFGPAAREARGSDAAEAVLLEFGSKLKNVPLTGEEAAVRSAVEENYAAYVTPELLNDWKTNVSHAPGRLTSSPWPERIIISSMSPQATGRIVNGEVVLVTSTEAAGEVADTVPFVALLIQTEEGWKIAAYQEEKVQTLKKLPTTDEDIPGAK